MGFILPLIGMAMSGVGAAIRNRQAQNQAKAIADARNRVLADTMAMNRPLADSSRAMFDQRIAAPIADETQPSVRSALLDDAVAPMPDVPVAGSAPEVVKSEIAGQMARAIEEGKAEAAASSKVGAYGDAWFNEGIFNTNLASGLGQNANFASGNLALLPHLQDLAEVQATKRPGPVADIFMGVGSALGSAGGAMGRRPVAPATTTGVFQGIRNNFFGTG